MKYCTKCGNDLVDEAVVCPKCGCAVPGTIYATNKPVQPKPVNGFAIAGFICSLLVPFPGNIMGCVLGGVGLAKSKEVNGKGKGLSIAAIIISIVGFLSNLILILLLRFGIIK